MTSDPHREAQEVIGDGPFLAHVPGQWLLDVIQASDLFGLDVYDYNHAKPSDVWYAWESIKFWQRYYSQGKPIFITENGFSSVLQNHPDLPAAYPGAPRWGTEAQQAEYFRALIPLLVRQNASPEGLNHQLIGYSCWMYHDYCPEWLKNNFIEQTFGLRRLDGSPKPAFDAVRDAYREIEGDPQTQPFKMSQKESVFSDKDTVPLYCSTGSDFQQIQLTFSVFKKSPRTLSLLFSSPCGALLSINGQKRIAQIKSLTPLHTVQIDADDLLEGVNVVTCLPTQDKWPFSVTLKEAKLFVDNRKQ